MAEIWKWIPGYEGQYEVSSLGNIRGWRGGNDKPRKSIRRARLLKPTANWNKYLLVGLKTEGSYALHRLIALTFHGPCPPALECAHLNGDRQDNRACNLKWVTRKENHSHKRRHGTVQRGENGPTAKLTNKDVLKIRSLYAKGKTQSEIARHYEVHQSCIWGIVRGKTWTHI